MFHGPCHQITMKTWTSPTTEWAWKQILFLVSIQLKIIPAKFGYGSEWDTIRRPRMSLDSWPVGSSWVTNAFFNHSASDIMIGKKRLWKLLLRQGRGQEWAVEKRVPLRMKQSWLCDLGTTASERMSPSCHTKHMTRLTSLSLPPWPQAIPIISFSDWIFERREKELIGNQRHAALVSVPPRRFHHVWGGESLLSWVFIFQFSLLLHEMSNHHSCLI